MKAKTKKLFYVEAALVILYAAILCARSLLMLGESDLAWLERTREVTQHVFEVMAYVLAIAVLIVNGMIVFFTCLGKTDLPRWTTVTLLGIVSLAVMAGSPHFTHLISLDWEPGLPELGLAAACALATIFTVKLLPNAKSDA